MRSGFALATATSVRPTLEDDSCCFSAASSRGGASRLPLLHNARGCVHLCGCRDADADARTHALFEEPPRGATTRALASVGESFIKKGLCVVLSGWEAFDARITRGYNVLRVVESEVEQEYKYHWVQLNFSDRFMMARIRFLKKKSADKYKYLME